MLKKGETRPHDFWRVSGHGVLDAVRNAALRSRRRPWFRFAELLKTRLIVLTLDVPAGIVRHPGLKMTATGAAPECPIKSCHHADGVDSFFDLGRFVCCGDWQN
jgi:hypothetical protein